LSSENIIVRYCYVPSSLVLSGSFQIEDVFSALGLKLPNLIFMTNVPGSYNNWNLRLPPYKVDLIGAKHPNPEDGDFHPGLRHYQKVVVENCKRLLKGASLACASSGAILKISPTWDPEKSNDAAEWLSSINLVPLLGLANVFEFYPELVREMMDRSETYSSSDENNGPEEIKNVIRVDTKPWHSGERKNTQNGNVLIGALPSPKLTHVIMSDKMELLQEVLEKNIPTGLILISGLSLAVDMFENSIQKGQPIFIFKNTGGLADLAVEMLAKVDKLIHRRKYDPAAIPEHPFAINLPPDYNHPLWVWPFNPVYIKMCQRLNILIENFPRAYNPTSVLVIDMFNTSEEKLQDQLTKTMSVVTEGGSSDGQSAESKRLTYAWRLRHLLLHNAKKHKLYADVLRFLTIFFAFLSTVSAVLCTYFNVTYPDDERTIYIFNLLTFLLPLVNTIFNGLFAAFNPLVKAMILIVSSSKIESEIYMYRTKCGPYSLHNQNSTSKQNSNQHGKKDEKQNPTAAITVNPSKHFSTFLDLIWADLAASDISKGKNRM